MSIETKKYNNLISISTELRKRIIKTSYEAKIPHIGSCLSCIELLVFLYWKELNIDPSNSEAINRDRFILSKGHGAPALFQVLGLKGFFPIERLNSFGKPGSVFHEHPPKPGYIPGIEAATGSLGHGFPMAVGMSLAKRINNLQYRTYSILSDGECNEGSIWEAAMFAGAQKLDDLTIFIDFNKWQATGRSKEVLALDPLKEKWQSFGWDVYEIDGHKFNQIDKSIELAKTNKNKPSAIIAHTIKGKGVSFMEDNNNWHYKTPNEEEFKKAFEELKN
ncbi:possible N-terminal fragment of transketolase [Prochlorococcus marinus subsp. pastoris str. CCMP1986]|uniref:Possible N-terminal of transketolase n=1 Tax=Prochlorococcus marinus subsp. pastoris (strain CCMP1986 / NIES-2087 / MED4) TaxID=59919 RepID=Q7V0M1_PROMP|nr:transketolase [Prochlorococcus marinus]KGF87202.1 Transketolase [Prochlorococcus marinus str. EQPAC1]CAE19694.1 possible N-terminal fragment of transketolase [Prochlorococcus marinus subsp. pastoris str. CCMP1986]